jgi:GR25 family glycosyltransferase involved in LPS biosynthesis
MNKFKQTIHPDISSIDIILIINLEKRTDRKEHIINQMNLLKIPENKYYIMKAVFNDNGAIGCYYSHINCIKFLLHNNYKNGLILEDDFTFKKSIITAKSFQILNYYLNNNFNFDIIMISGNILISKQYDNFLDKCINAQTTSGYIVNAVFYNKLLENYQDGLNKLLTEPTNKEQYAIDIYWKILQPISNWYSLNKLIGYQYISYSDIENKIVDYKC